MEALIQAYWRILLLRQGPQSIPASNALLWLALLLHYLVGTLHSLFVMPLHQAIVYALVSTLAMVGIVHGFLLLFKKTARFFQTVTALAGCEAILGAVLLPANLLVEGEGSATGLVSIVAILSLLTIGWNVAVAAHIFRHALAVSMGRGFVFSVIYFIIAISLSNMAGVTGSAG